MKKTITALAVLGSFAGAASAQTSVTMYGSYDNSLRYLTNVDAAGHSKLSMNSLGVYNSNRLGFKGIEDLGDGMYARFVLEAAFSGGTGAGADQLFGRESTVGIGDSWGEVVVGRQFSVNARTLSGYDPFSFKYLSIVPLSKETIGISSARFSNDVQYTGKFDDLTVRAEYVPGEVAGGGFSTGTAFALGGTYVLGSTSVGAAYTKWNDFGGPGLDRTQGTIGVSYLIGPGRITGGYMDDSQKAIGSPTTSANTWIGGTYNFSPAFALTAAYYKTKGAITNQGRNRHLMIMGVTYFLSKRTNLYAEIDRNTFGGAAVVNGQQTQTGITSGLAITF
jgi:predicted porin